MERSPFLPLPEGMVIGQVEITAAQLTVEVISTQPSARCPECGSPSDHVHCQYQRTVHDVPCGGRNVVLRLGVRKFARLHSDMPTKSFCRTPSRSGPALGTGEQSSPGRVESPGALRQWMPVSERLAPRLGMQVKAPTLLRYLRTIPSLSDEPVRVLGIDDFAIRRGDCYGTILVNLETSKPLDLLPDRTAEAVLPWLKDHQEIEVVSRDRASGYADAVKRALPHAIQVADRYHLVQNLREHLQRFLDRKRTCLPEVEDIPLKAVSTSGPGSGGSMNDQIDQIGAVTSTVSAGSSQAERTDQPEAQVEPELPHALVGQEIELASLTYAERKKKISRDKRYARYEHLLALHRAGMSGRAIARALHMSRRIVQRYLDPRRLPGTCSRFWTTSIWQEQARPLSGVSP
jgi:Transposase/zinc-finger of transposase IS204/IS1001/IS1096/IS1165